MKPMILPAPALTEQNESMTGEFQNASVYPAYFQKFLALPVTTAPYLKILQIKMMSLHALMAEVQFFADKLGLPLFFRHIFYMGSKIINILCIKHLEVLWWD